MELKIIAENSDLIPKKANPTDACFDLYAAEDAVVPACGSISVSTGIKMCIPENYYVEIRPRSGLAFKHNVQCFMGSIDSGYLNTVKVLLENSGVNPYRVHTGDRIAQFRMCKLEPTEIVNVDSFGDAFDRGGGFGHSGV